jgi:TPR repeat protein
MIIRGKKERQSGSRRVRSMWADRAIAVRLQGLAAAGLVAVACNSAPAAMTPQENQQAVQYQQQQNWSGLLQLAQRAIGENRKDGWAWYYAGIAEDGLGRKADAVSAYETALPLMTGYTRDAIAQGLGADYAALGQGSKLAALIQQLQSSDPQEAASLKAQFSGAVTAPAAATSGGTSGGLPDVSPQSLGALETRVRGSWQRDAVPVRATVQAMDGGGFQTAYYFYSPSTRAGETVTVSPTTTTASTVTNPTWGTAAIPLSFRPLASAISTSGSGLELATLTWNGATTNPINLVWFIAAKTGGGDASVLPAYVMTAAQLQQLQAGAGSGNATDEYVLGGVYATGLAGTTNPSLAEQWIAKAAQAANVPAENKLGQYEQLGFGLAANASVAAQWYARAAQAGYAPAEFNLGLLYEIGLGVQQNWITAAQWITAAAKQGLQPAVMELNYVNNTAKRVEHAQQLAAQQRQSSGCPWNEQMGAMGYCYPKPGITAEVTQTETAGAP